MPSAFNGCEAVYTHPVQESFGIIQDANTCGDCHEISYCVLTRVRFVDEEETTFTAYIVRDLQPTCLRTATASDISAARRNEHWRAFRLVAQRFRRYLRPYIRLHRPRGASEPCHICLFSTNTYLPCCHVSVHANCFRAYIAHHSYVGVPCVRYCGTYYTLP